jgi:hypothetical protein
MSIKICFAASSGGHFEQLLMLKPLFDQYDSILITEKTEYELTGIEKRTIYYLKQVNRKESTFIIRFLINSLKSLKILQPIYFL